MQPSPTQGHRALPVGLKLLFCDTFRSVDRDDELDNIRFKTPVHLHQLRVLRQGETPHASVPLGIEGETTPDKFNVSIFARNKLDADAATFESLTEKMAYDASNNYMAVLDAAVLTDHVALSGDYTAITLCLYGVLPNDAAPEEKPVTELQEVIETETVSMWSPEKVAECIQCTPSSDISSLLFDSPLPRPKCVHMLTPPSSLLQASKLHDVLWDAFEGGQCEGTPHDPKRREEWEFLMAKDATALCLELARFVRLYCPDAVPKWVERSFIPRGPDDEPTPRRRITPDEGRAAMSAMVSLLEIQPPARPSSPVGDFDDFAAATLASLPVLEMLHLLLAKLLPPQKSKVKAIASSPSSPSSSSSPPPTYLTGEAVLGVLLRMLEHPTLMRRFADFDRLSTWKDLYTRCIEVGGTVEGGQDEPSVELTLPSAQTIARFLREGTPSPAMKAYARAILGLWDSYESLTELHSIVSAPSPSGPPATACLRQFLSMISSEALFLPDLDSPRTVLTALCAMPDGTSLIPPAPLAKMNPDGIDAEPFNIIRIAVATNMIPSLCETVHAALDGRGEGFEAAHQIALFLLLRLLASRQGLSLLAHYPKAVQRLLAAMRGMAQHAPRATELSSAVPTWTSIETVARCSKTLGDKLGILLHGVGHPSSGAVGEEDLTRTLMGVLWYLLPLHLHCYGILDRLADLHRTNPYAASATPECGDLLRLLHLLSYDSPAAVAGVAQVLSSMEGADVALFTLKAGNSSNRLLNYTAHVLLNIMRSPWGIPLLLARGKQIAEIAKETVAAVPSADTEFVMVWKELVSYADPAAFLTSNGLDAFLPYFQVQVLHLKHLVRQLASSNTTRTLRPIDGLLTTVLSSVTLFATLSRENTAGCLTMLRRFGVSEDRFTSVITLCAEILSTFSSLLLVPDLRSWYALRLSVDYPLTTKHAALFAAILQITENVLGELRRANTHNISKGHVGAVVFRNPTVLKALLACYDGLVHSQSFPEDFRERCTSSIVRCVADLWWTPSTENNPMGREGHAANNDVLVGFMKDSPRNQYSVMQLLADVLAYIDRRIRDPQHAVHGPEAVMMSLREDRDVDALSTSSCSDIDFDTRPKKRTRDEDEETEEEPRMCRLGWQPDPDTIYRNLVNPIMHTLVECINPKDKLDGLPTVNPPLAFHALRILRYTAPNQLPKPSVERDILHQLIVKEMKKSEDSGQPILSIFERTKNKGSTAQEDMAAVELAFTRKTPDIPLQSLLVREVMQELKNMLVASTAEMMKKSDPVPPVQAGPRWAAKGEARRTAREYLNTSRPPSKHVDDFSGVVQLHMAADEALS